MDARVWRKGGGGVAPRGRSIGGVRGTRVRSSRGITSAKGARLRERIEVQLMACWKAVVEIYKNTQQYYFKYLMFCSKNDFFST